MPIKLKRTAYHEAGHAVMAYCLNDYIRHVSIIPEGGILGHLQRGKRENLESDKFNPSARTRNRIEKKAMVSWGGNVAEHLLTRHKYRTVSEQDEQDVFYRLLHLSSNAQEAGAYSDWLWYRTKTMLQASWHWAATEALARELFDHRYIGGNRVRQIIKESIHAFIPKEPHNQEMSLANVNPL
jgi:hypothetical protein